MSDPASQLPPSIPACADLPRLGLDYFRAFTHEIFGDHLHAKRVVSLGNALAGAAHAAQASVHAIGAAYAALAGTQTKHGIKQVNRRLSTWVRQTFGEITEGHLPSRAGLPEQPRRPALRSAETVPRGTWRSLQVGLGRRAGHLVPGANKSPPGSRSSLSDGCPFLTIPPALSVVG